MTVSILNITGERKPFMHGGTSRGLFFSAALLIATVSWPGVARPFDVDNTSGAAPPEPSGEEPAATQPGLCWSEPYDLDLPKVSSEIVPGLFTTELADDFALPPHTEVLITKVRWWSGPYEGSGGEADGFRLSIYVRAGLKPAVSPLLTVENLHPEGVYVGDDVFGGPTYQYEVDVEIPLKVSWDPVFYLVVQTEHSFPVPQWGMQGSVNADRSLPYFRGPFFGFPKWTLFREIVEYLYGAAFELECEGGGEESRGSFTVSSFTDDGGAPRIAGIHPNPVRRAATIELFLADPAPVVLRILDVTGREVATVAAGAPGAGRRTVTWSRDPRAVRSGIYLLRLMQGGATETRKLLVID